MYANPSRSLQVVLGVGLLTVCAASTNGQYIYWRDGAANGGQIYRVGDDGAGVEFILDGFVYYSYSIDPVDRKIYLAHQDRKIRRANIDGTNVEDVFTSSLGSPLRLQADPIGRKIYYHLFDPGGNPQQIRRVNFDGSGDELLVTLPSSTVWASLRALDLHLPSQSIYWMFLASASTPPQLWKASLDGSNPQMVMELDSAPPLRMSIDPVHDTLYWCTEAFDSPIFKLHLSDLTSEALQIADFAVDVAVDPMDERVYWLEHNVFEMRRMDLDGSNPQLLVETVFPHDLDFLPFNDCNANGMDDWCEMSCGSAGGYCDVPGCGVAADVNRNGRLDICDDCDSNGIADRCDVTCGPASGPCDVPGCGLGPDCNGTGKLDACDILGARSLDCNGNSVPDECDTASTSSADCNLNSVPDECETLGADCNGNAQRDDCDTVSGSSADCNLNRIPDECETLNVDCNSNSIRDDCDIATGPSNDCNLNAVPDECDLPSTDCNANGVRDDCDLASGFSHDCDDTGVIDECEIAPLEHQLYWADTAQGKIYRSSPTGGTSQEVLTTIELPSSIAIDPVDRKLYYANDDGNNTGLIYRSNLDGSGAEEFPVPYDGCRELVLDWQGRKLYFATLGPAGSQLYRIELTGGYAAEVVDYTSRDYGALDLHGPSRGIYRLTGSSLNTLNKVNRSNFDEPRDDHTVIGTAQGEIPGLAIDPVSHALFYARQNKLYRSDYLGAAPVQIATATVANLEIDPYAADNWLYYSEGAGGRILRIRSDGSSLQVIQSGIGNPGPIAFAGSLDCNGNGIDDVCEVTCGTPCGPCDVPGCGTKPDCDRNGRLDECEAASDCNSNGNNDRCDTGAVPRRDCNYNLTPDNCDGDCNANNVADDCDLSRETSADCNANSIPDECDIAAQVDTDCNSNIVPDQCEPETSFDCNGNSQRDDCDVFFAQSSDADGDGIPDECRVDPHALGADPSGYAKSRFISFEVQAIPGGATQSAIRVKLVSLHHPEPPYTGGATIPFTLFEGATMWVGPPTQFVESGATPVPFYGAYLQCTPHFRDWSTIGLLHVSGAAVVPSSVYEVQNVAHGCEANLQGCAAVSELLEIRTTRWGDVEAAFSPPATTDQPDVGDISALVNKFKNAPGAPIKARALLAEPIPSPFLDLSFAHISACVDAFRGQPYPYEPGVCRDYSQAYGSCGGYLSCGDPDYFYCSLCEP